MCKETGSNCGKGKKERWWHPTSQIDRQCLNALGKWSDYGEWAILILKERLF